MSRPPDKIDGATVLWFADVSNLKKTDHVRHFDGSQHQLTFKRLAVCKYEGATEVYLFHCDERWNTENDDLFDSVEAAMTSAIRQYSGLKRDDFTQVSGATN